MSKRTQPRRPADLDGDTPDTPAAPAALPADQAADLEAMASAPAAPAEGPPVVLEERRRPAPARDGVDELDPVTEDERAKLRARKAGEAEDGVELFSCPFPGCRVRISRTSDDGVRFEPSSSSWFCGEGHRAEYLQMRGF